MRKIVIATALIGLGSYLIYKVYNNIGNTFFNLNDFIPDEGVGNSYVDMEKGMRPRYEVQDGVGGSDFFDIGEGGVTGVRPAESFE